MDQCPKIETCSFFSERMESMPSIVAYFKKRFCQAEYNLCARYYLHNFLAAKGPEIDHEMQEKIADLSANMFPDELDLARTILQGTD